MMTVGRCGLVPLTMVPASRFDRVCTEQSALGKGWGALGEGKPLPRWRASPSPKQTPSYVVTVPVSSQ